MKKTIFPISYLMLCLVLLSGLSVAANWTMDGDSVYWRQGNAEIRAWPAVSTGFIDHFQEINWTWNESYSITANLSLVFHTPLTSGNAYLWQNITKTRDIWVQGRINQTTKLYDVLSYNPTSLRNCSFGDENNTLFYEVNTINTTGIVACFNSATNISSNWTLISTVNGQVFNHTQTYYEMGWVSISSLFSHFTYGTNEIYTINDVTFSPATNYITRFEYTTPTSAASGKFDLYIHAGSPQQVIDGQTPIYVQLDPWWNNSCTISYFISTPPSINTVNGTGNNPPLYVSINSSNCSEWNCTTGGNLRITDCANTTSLPYGFKNKNATYLGNATNNLSVYFSPTNVGQTIQGYNFILCPLGTVSGENLPLVASNANITNWYLMNSNVSIEDVAGDRNLPCVGSTAIFSAGSRGGYVQFQKAYCYNSSAGAPPQTKGQTQTISMWKKDTTYNGNTLIVTVGSSYPDTEMQYYTNYAWMDDTNSAVSPSLPIDGNFSYWAMGYDQVARILWHNTILNKTTTSISVGSDSAISIGARAAGTAPAVNTDVYEARFRSANSSADYVAAEQWTGWIVGPKTTLQTDFITITSIGVSPNPPGILDDLTCWAVANSSFTSMNFTGNWSKNGIVQTALEFNTSALPNGTNNSLNTISHLLVSPLDNWSCSAVAFNGSTYSDLATSANDTEPNALNCSNLSLANTIYNLSRNVSVLGTSCFNITGVNISLNCAGFHIFGNNSTDTAGVYSNANNSTIKNCQISNFSNGVYLNLSYGSTIFNNTINTTYVGGTGVKS